MFDRSIKPGYTMPKQNRVCNGCFEMGDSVCVQYCLFCSTEQAYHLWKHWRPIRSVQIINMHGNQYIFGSGGVKKWENTRKEECSSSFIGVIYSLLLSFLCSTRLHTHFPTYACKRTHTYTHADADNRACGINTQIPSQQREREYVRISKLYILFFSMVPVGLCSV